MGHNLNRDLHLTKINPAALQVSQKAESTCLENSDVSN